MADLAPPTTPDPVLQIGKGSVRLRVHRDSPPPPLITRPTRYGRRRALSLLIVNLLMVAHFIHWRFADQTLAPLEPSEARDTLERGLITAGFLLFCTAILATAVFGRFFCGWGCHILALEDACAWMLGKVGIRPKPIRSRLFALIPPFAFVYMFIWPTVYRIFEGVPAAAWRFSTDAEGFGSLVTNDYWRAMPGPFISVLTFAVCGFAIVYVLGARSFCQYGCPYGAIFRAADSFAPGRVHLTGDCHQCGHCTAVCNSNVRVHEEVAQFGKVVDMACMRDLDCVAACPNEAITFSYSPPPLLIGALRAARRRLRPDFTLLEETVTVVAFLTSLFIYRGLYDTIPFLLALGWSTMLAYSAVLAFRLAFRPVARFNAWTLKAHGRLRRPGFIACFILLLLLVLTAHSGYIRCHEHLAHRAFAQHTARAPGTPFDPALAQAELRHLNIVDRWGLYSSSEMHIQLVHLNFALGDREQAIAHLNRLIARDPDDLGSRIMLATTLQADGFADRARREAEALLERADHITPTTTDKAHALTVIRARAHAMLAQIAAERGDAEVAIDHLNQLLELQPDNQTARMLLNQLLKSR